MLQELATVKYVTQETFRYENTDKIHKSTPPCEALNK